MDYLNQLQLTYMTVVFFLVSDSFQLILSTVIWLQRYHVIPLKYPDFDFYVTKTVLYRFVSSKFGT
ncbi:uncharacterized protein Smp_201990 [Schistosoma mansoni]|uniref:uncharacterized protein n=1 Tax=Schistosoma mansoni TaxID=6183 RepID=UPI00022DC8CD|nr:uncharacterized protein Smp_201990 [Schistosoma mansoni]|eukprot:XP_018650776.1 uncharacterized protein Smp_201990 [Schistosoma mansoni]